MNDVWFRGPVRLDLLTASTIVSCAAWDRADLALDAFQSVEPGTLRSYNPGNPWSQRVYLLVSANYVFVAVPGTETWQQWVGNVLGSVQVPAPAGPGRVAQYWSNLAQGLYATIRADLLAAMPGRRLVIAGYSLGAAVAQILGALIREETGADLRLHLFASPRAGDAAFAAGYGASQVWRIEGPNDPVPFVPPVVWGGAVLPLPYPGPLLPVFYSQPGNGYALDAAGGLSVAGTAPGYGILSALLSGADPRQTHALESYTALLREQLPTPVAVAGQMGYADPAAIDRVLLALQNQSGAAWGLPVLPQAAPPILDALDLPGGAFMWRATFFHTVPSGQITETYYLAADSPGLVVGAAETLAKKRINMMGTGCSIDSVRISDTALFRDYGEFDLGYTTGTETDDDLLHVKPFMRVLMNLINGPYRNRVFLCGVAAKNYLGDRPLNLKPDFTKALKEWATELRNRNWCMAVSGRFGDDLVGGNVTGATLATPIVIQTGAAHPLVDGDSVAIRGVKGNTAANGSHYVQVVDPTHFQLLGTVGNGAYLSGGKWRKKYTVYKTILDVKPVREVSRKAGRPSA